MERILAMTNHDGLCWKCLQSVSCSDINVINIHELGYGSQFDGISTEIHLCEECYKESIKENSDLWSMKTREFNEYCEEYLYEDQMIDYINQMPIQGRQFVKNEFCNYVCQMEPQDWIDFELDILPPEKRIEYGFDLPNITEEDSKELEYVEYLIYKAKVDEYEKKHGSIRNI